MSRIRIRVLSVVAAGVLLGCLAGGAQAGGVSVTAAVRTQERIVKHSAGYRSLKRIGDVRTARQARLLITRDRRLQRLLMHAATVVSRASATDTRQKIGRHDWVVGVRYVARGVGLFDAAMKRVLAGRAAAAKRELLRAKHTLAVGNAVGTRGDRLLGLPTSG